jgi:uncharacterized membrane protein YraQ (UPF0718 family)
MSEFVMSILTDFWNTVAEMSPYLLFGFFMAGVLSVFVSQRLVEKHLGGGGIWPVVKASLFGVPLPLCSCSVIPVTMSLHKHGASKGAAVSFLLSTPQTGVDSILVTYSLLGPVFAIFRPLAAFATGIVGGVLVNLFGRPSGSDLQQRQHCTDECCSGEHSGSRITQAFKYGFVTLPRDIGRAMLLGLVVAAFISALVPDGFFADKLGTGIFAMVVMMAIGIPMYVCATASVPIAAALMMKGLTPGAALVFLMTGPATNAASFVTIWQIMGRATAITYLATVAGCALLSGVLLDYIVSSVTVEHAGHHNWMLPPVVKHISAVALLAVLVFAVLRKKEQVAEPQVE